MGTKTPHDLSDTAKKLKKKTKKTKTKTKKTLSHEFLMMLQSRSASESRRTAPIGAPEHILK